MFLRLCFKEFPMSVVHDYDDAEVVLVVGVEVVADVLPQHGVVR